MIATNLANEVAPTSKRMMWRYILQVKCQWQRLPLTDCKDDTETCGRLGLRIACTSNACHDSICTRTPCHILYTGIRRCCLPKTWMTSNYSSCSHALRANCLMARKKVMWCECSSSSITEMKQHYWDDETNSLVYCRAWCLYWYVIGIKVHHRAVRRESAHSPNWRKKRFYCSMHNFMSMSRRHL